jgi:chromosome segregation ATPase
MSVNASVQTAHDALLAMPEVSAAGHTCALCTAGTHARVKEGASVSDTAPANVYTEAQHFALLESAVERETAKLSEAKETLETQLGTLESEKAALADELAGTKSRLDVAEAEKAAAEARADAAAKELADFKAELARAAEVAEKRTARIERVKAANSSLGEDYFTTERAQRWAEMSDEGFEALVADLIEAAAAAKPADSTDTTSATELARESAAFAGGQTATSIQGETALAQLLGARRRGSAA